MPLTLRPTGLSPDPNANDWSIYEDGVEIGRLYEDLQASRPENRWFWSITVMGPARFRVRWQPGYRCGRSGKAEGRTQSS